MVKMRIGTKVYLALAVLALVAVLVGSLAIVSLRSYKAVVDDMGRESRSAVLAERLNGLVLAVVMDSRGIYMAASHAEAEKYAPPLLKNLDRLRDVLRAWRDQVAPERRAGFDAAEKATEDFIRFRTELVRLSREVGLVEARAFGDNDANRAVRSALNDRVKVLAAANEQQVSRLSTLVDSDYSAKLATIGTVLILGLLAGGGIAFTVVSRGIVRPLTAITETMRRLAAGDLAVAVPFTGATDEIGTVAAAVQVFKEAGIENQRLQRAREVDQETAREHLRSEMLTLTEVLEGEVATTVGDISLQADRLTEGAVQLSETAMAFQEMARTVATAVSTASRNVQTVAGATEELEASGREISSQIASSSRLAEDARQQAGLASASVGGLISATERIDDVVLLITAIAKQTRMLALNAHIEAARAGETGRGFAIVADEVKHLAQQTEEGIGKVSAQAEEIGVTTRQAIDTVGTVAATIQNIDDIAHQVAQSADQQRAATAEIMESAVQAAGHTSSVADNAQEMLNVADQTGRIADKLSELSTMVSRDIGALQRRLGIILRNSAGGDRRDSARAAVSIPFSADLGGEQLSGHTCDISVSGALLVVGSARRQAATTGTLDLVGVGRVEVQVLVESPLGIHVRFVNLGAAGIEALERAIERAGVENQRYVVLAQGIAAQVATAFGAAVASRRLSESDLFSTLYTAIPATNPQQVLAAHTDLADQVLPPMIEPPLAVDAKIAFCCVTDRNGLVSTHNRICSQPQRPGDPVWNAANSRNRVIFDDRTGILAARCKEPYLIQTYARTLAPGKIQLLKEIDAPIVIAGKHWGAVRLAVNL